MDEPVLQADELDELQALIGLLQVGVLIDEIGLHVLVGHEVGSKGGHELDHLCDAVLRDLLLVLEVLDDVLVHLDLGDFGTDKVNL